jgi:cytosine/adenosine deaminase-related metal-dependent hydrolase
MPQGQPRHAVSRLAEEGLLGPDLQFVHCTGTTDEEFGLLADSDGKVAITPSCEVAIALGIPPTGRARAQGIAPAFGCDTVGATSGDLFDEARTGLLFERVLAQQPLYARGEEVVESAQLGFTALEALQAITINAARSMWMDDVVGSLTPGKRADVIMLRATDPNLAPMNNVVETVVSCAHSGNIDTVMIDGEIVKRDGRLTFVDLDEVNGELAECRDRIFAQSGYDGIQPPVRASVG